MQTSVLCSWGIEAPSSMLEHRDAAQGDLSHGTCAGWHQMEPNPLGAVSPCVCFLVFEHPLSLNVVEQKLFSSSHDGFEQGRDNSGVCGFLQEMSLPPCLKKPSRSGSRAEHHASPGTGWQRAVVASLWCHHSHAAAGEAPGRPPARHSCNDWIPLCCSPAQLVCWQPQLQGQWLPLGCPWVSLQSLSAAGDGFQFWSVSAS